MAQRIYMRAIDKVITSYTDQLVRNVSVKDLTAKKEIIDMQAGVYRHFKGGLYQCLGIAAHSETNERMVVYVSLTGANLSGPRLRVRPLSMWNEIVDWPKGGRHARFMYVGEEINLVGEDKDNVS